MHGEQQPNKLELTPAEFLTERLQFWNEQLEELAALYSDISGNTIGDELTQEQLAAYKAISKQAIPELDGILTDMNILGAECLVSGFARWSEQIDPKDADTIDPNELIPITPEIIFRVRHERTPEKLGFSGGFAITNIQVGGKLGLWHQINLSQVVAFPDPTLRTTSDTVLLLDPLDSCIVPTHIFEEPFWRDPAVFNLQPASPGNEEEALFSYSDVLMQMLRSTGFRRQNRKKQAQMIDNLLERAESVTGIREQEVAVQSDYAYKKEIGQNSVEYKIICIRGLTMYGTCLGLSSSNRETLRTKAIRRDSDLFNKYDGMLMDIEIEAGPDVPRHLNLKDEQIIHVPLSNQNIVFDLISNAVRYELEAEEGEHESSLE